MKNIAELRKKEAAIKKILDSGVREKLMKIPGVTHVSVGLKEKGNSATDEFSIRVYVKEKKDKSQLTHKEIIPTEIQGVKTDVNQVSKSRMLVDNTQYIPIKGGIQIRIGNSFGTLGCLAKDTSNNIVMVTCAHVGGFPAAGQNIFQPDFGATPAPTNVIGVTTANQATNPSVDCAAHTVNVTTLTTNTMNNLSIAMTKVGAAVAGARVYKVGRTTGLTRGKIIDANAATSVDGYPGGTPPNGTINFTGAIKIQALFKYTECCCCTCYDTDTIFRFSDQGDSGSVVIMSDGTGVGLLFADNEGPGGPDSPHETFACSLAAVQTALNVTITPTVADSGPNVPIVSLPQPASVIEKDKKGKKLTAAQKAKAAKSKHAAKAKPPLKAAHPEKEKMKAAMEMDNLLSSLEDKLNATESGADLLQLITGNRTEILDLINHKRPVTIIWHHSQGPAFTAHFMNSLKDAKYVIPKDVNSVTLKMLAIKMAAVLQEYGSPKLKTDIDKHISDLLYYADHLKSIRSLLTTLKNNALA